LVGGGGKKKKKGSAFRGPKTEKPPYQVDKESGVIDGKEDHGGGEKEKYSRHTQRDLGGRSRSFCILGRRRISGLPERFST